MTLSDEALAARAALDAEWRARARDLIDGRRPMVQGARTLGSLALVTPGCAVWTDPDRKRTSHDDPLGGIVLEITTRTTIDDNGEITDHRAFHCYDPLVSYPDRSFRVFAEDLIPQAGVEGIDTSSVVTAIRRFARTVGAGRGLLVGSEADLIRHAYHLTTAVMGGTL